MKRETVLNKNISRNKLIAAIISQNILGVLIMATQMESHLVEDVRYILLWARLFSKAQLRSVFAGQ